MEVLIALWGSTLVCLLAVSHAAAWHWEGREEGKPWSDHLEESPSRLRKCLSEGFGGGVRGCSLTLPNCSPLLPLLHSARHLKALVMHSSSPATSSVIQFPRQWGCVKFQLRLCVRRAVKTSLPPSCFVCLLLSPHKKQQEPGRWCNLGIYHSGKKWIWILQLSFSRLN